MPANESSTWNNNQGNLLLIFAGVAAAFMCGIWYFDLMPTISPAPKTAPQRTMRETRDPAILVVTVVAPTKIEGKRLPADGVNTMVRVHSGFGDLLDTSVPIAIREFNLEAGGQQTVVFSELPPGTYSVVAILDLNGDSQLEFDEAGKPIEPVRISGQDPNPDSIDLSDAGVQIQTGVPMQINLEFENS